MTPLMVSVSGIRGIVGESLTPGVVSGYADAFGTFCKGGTVVVGRDTRRSGPMMEHAVFAGLMAAGCRIINIGINPTPTVQLAVEKLGASGGIAITASHNPEEWNALKFINKEGRFLGKDDIDRISNDAEKDTFENAEISRLGEVETIEDIHADHIRALLELETVKVDKIRKHGFKTVVDCVNGAGSIVLPELLHELGCEVLKVNCDPDKPFGRGAEPLPENLDELCKSVRKNNADIGFACDPDADRLAIVDENGKAIGEDYTLVLAADYILGMKNGAIATNASTTMLIDYIARKYNRDVFRSKVGEIHVVEKMIENSCVIGGEGNGGVIYPALHYGRDALTGIALVLMQLSSSGKSVSGFVDENPKYYMTKKKADITGTDLGSVFERVKKTAGRGTLDRTDGLKLIYSDRWIHLRASNTEPVIRIITEAPTRDESEKLADKYINLLKTE